MMSYSVAITYFQPAFIYGRCLLHPQSEDAPDIDDEQTRINNVVIIIMVVVVVVLALPSVMVMAMWVTEAGTSDY
jgi:hypothetical protein